MCLYMCMHACVYTGCMCFHTAMRRWRCVCNGSLFPGTTGSLLPGSQLPEQKTKCRIHWAAFSGPFRSLLQVQFAASPALMGCRLCPWTITLSQPNIYGTGKAFSLNKSKVEEGSGAQRRLAWSSGSPRVPGTLTIQTDSLSRPPGFWGVGWDGN